jgi:hypothetical protein
MICYLSFAAVEREAVLTNDETGSGRQMRVY